MSLLYNGGHDIPAGSKPPLMLVLEAVIPVVLVALLGFGARQSGVLTVNETDAIEKISLWYLLPCLLFVGTATASFPTPMNWQFLGMFYLVVLFVYATGVALGRILFSMTLLQLSVFGMGGAYANVTVLGIPVILQVLGQDAFIPMLVVIAIHNLVLFSVGTVLAEIPQNQHFNPCMRLYGIARDVVTNPVSGSLLAGAVFNFSGLTLFGPLQATVELLGRAAIPGALLGLGAAIHRYRIKGELKTTFTMVAIKLLLLPLMMWTGMRLGGFSGLWADTAVLVSAMPVGISVYVFSRRYQCCEAVAASAIVLSSLLGTISISAIAWLLVR